jgi:hypothetical protein
MHCSINFSFFPLFPRLLVSAIFDNQFLFILFVGNKLIPCQGLGTPWLCDVASNRRLPFMACCLRIHKRHGGRTLALGQILEHPYRLTDFLYAFHPRPWVLFLACMCIPPYASEPKARRKHGFLCFLDSKRLRRSNGVKLLPDLDLKATMNEDSSHRHLSPRQHRSSSTLFEFEPTERSANQAPTSNWEQAQRPSLREVPLAFYHSYIEVRSPDPESNLESEVLEYRQRWPGITLPWCSTKFWNCGLQFFLQH